MDVTRARGQHAAYAEALAACGWMIQEAPAAEDCPDSVFIEDTVVVCEDLAVLTRPGAPTARASASCAHCSRRGRTVIAVPLSGVLHLKSAVTALPDGTFLLLPQLVPAGLFPAVPPVDEESGCHVVRWAPTRC